MDPKRDVLLALFLFCTEVMSYNFAQQARYAQLKRRYRQLFGGSRILVSDDAKPRPAHSYLMSRDFHQQDTLHYFLLALREADCEA